MTAKDPEVSPDLTDEEQVDLIEQTDNRLSPEDEDLPQPDQDPDVEP